MTRSTLKASIGVLVLGVLSLPRVPATAAAPEGYHDHDAITATLREHASGRAIATVGSMGKSFEGRDLWILTLGTPEPGKPVVYVDAGHDGTELAATEVVLRMLDHLLTDLPPDSLLDLLDDATLQIVPRANPDAAERALSGPSVRGWIPRPLDEDRDGRIDEDGPDDLDGDGEILWMRVPDPAGEWTVDPADPRLLVEREAGDEGPFYRRYREGRDGDGDWLLNEDGEGGVALLHNFPQGWELSSQQPGAGRHAASELETVAILEHFVATPEIGQVVSFGAAHRPERPGAGHDTRIPASDRAVYEELDALVKEVRDRGLDVDFSPSGPARVGGAGQFHAPAPEGSPQPTTPRAVVPGWFVDWAFFQWGAYALAPALWLDPPPLDDGDASTDADPMDTPDPDGTADDGTGDDGSGADTPDASDPGDAAGADDDDDAAGDAKTRDERGKAWLDWIDATGSDGFVDWHPIDHPQLGTVEVGGFRSDPRMAPPAAVLDSLAAEAVALVVGLLERAPRLEVTAVTTETLSGNVHRVTATVTNTGRTPTNSAQGAAARLFHPVLAELDTPGSVTLVDCPDRVSLGELAPGERREIEWMVSGPAGEPIDVRAWSVRAGSGQATAILGRGGSR